MIRETQASSKTGVYKETSVVLHCYTLTRDNTKKAWSYSEDINPNPNDGNRHKIRSFVIAHNNLPYPDKVRLKNILTAAITDHSNIKNSKNYGEKLDGFCPKCLANEKKECELKFGSDW